MPELPILALKNIHLCIKEAPLKMKLEILEELPFDFFLVIASRLFMWESRRL